MASLVPDTDARATQGRPSRDLSWGIRAPGGSKRRYTLP